MGATPRTDRHRPVVSQTSGYAPLRDCAVIDDGWSAALVARDGSVDWLGLPDLDSPAAFGAVLDADRGGGFRMEPAVPFRSDRRSRARGMTTVTVTAHHPLGLDWQKKGRRRHHPPHPGWREWLGDPAASRSASERRRCDLQR
ncbi:trehalase-like domain-containing protein [Streptomyces diastatochromogenes]|uniref:trehalase-like domain-containing protein n=1 Tax=Streptomyces diastatochromogenes TaxID=42236 RepID=UPI0036C5498A